jgi:hypothetical protein
MRKKSFIISVGVIFSFLLIIASFSEPEKDVSINVRFTINYKDDNWDKNRTGLLWALSYLGAELPVNSFDKSIVWIDKKTFRLQFDQLGFNEKALAALGTICDSIKNTSVYKKQGCTDIGHFISITVGSSWHYYKITGVPETYAEFLKLHDFKDCRPFALTKSCVSAHHRYIKMSADTSCVNSAFIAEEGTGDLIDGSFKPSEFEVMDVMKNGQLRFMVYDASGRLTDAGNKLFGESGKPAKCIWCHEINIQPLFLKADTVTGFMAPGEFQEIISRQNKALNKYRETLNGEIDFKKLQDHTYMELIYISYMEPSMDKLVQEWNISKADLTRILQNKPIHIHSEFPYLGNLYDRTEIKSATGNDPGKIPSSIREKNESEPDYLRNL